MASVVELELELLGSPVSVPLVVAALVVASPLLLGASVLLAPVTVALLVTVKTPESLESTSVVEVERATWVELSPVAGTHAASPSSSPSLRMPGT